MIEFLDSAAEILDAEQFAALTRHLAERREAGRDEIRTRFSERRGAQVARGLDRRAGTIIRILNLEGSQAEAVRKVYEASVSRRQAVWEEVAAKKLDREAAVESMRRIETEDSAAIRASLTDAQKIRFDAVQDLLPAGPNVHLQAPGVRGGRPGAGRGGAGRPGPDGRGGRGR